MGPNFLSLLAHKTDTIISVTTPKPNSISVPECAFTLDHRSLNRFTSDWTNFSLASKQCHPRRNHRIVAFQPNVQPLDFSQAWDWVPLKHGGNVSGELHALKPCKSRVDRKNSLQIQIMTLTAFPRPFATSSRGPILPSRTFLCHQEKTQTMTGNDDVSGVGGLVSAREVPVGQTGTVFGIRTARSTVLNAQCAPPSRENVGRKCWPHTLHSLRWRVAHDPAGICAFRVRVLAGLLADAARA